MTWIAKADIYSGVQKAFAAGEEVPDGHVKAYNWQDQVERKQEKGSSSSAPDSLPKEVKK